jgi:hypothetical protein
MFGTVIRTHVYAAPRTRRCTQHTRTPHSLALRAFPRMSAILTSMIYTLHGFNSATEDCCQTLARVKMRQYGKPNHFCVGNDEKQMMPPQK